MAYMQWNDKVSAHNEIDEDDEMSYVDRVASHRLTAAGIALLEQWCDDKTCLDGLTILWADRVLAPQLLALAGLWWDEDYAPEELRCPRGGALPSRLDQFTRTLVAPDFAFDASVSLGL